MMKRALLRLKCGRGSVLFFIVAIMSVMIVLASAVYYSAVSARKQVEIRYGDEQSYQSAVSLNDLVTEYLNTKTEDAFVDAILALAPGSSLTTQGTGTDSFAKLAEGLGDYKVTVTKISGDSSDEKHTVKIETEVIVDGESSTVTSVGEFTLVSKPYSFDRFFTSTGYAPNDVVMSGMTITSTMYLDNEYSQIGSLQSGNSGINIKAEVISAGTLAINNAPINADGDKSFDITVGNNLLMTYGIGQGQGGQAAMNLNGGRIRVGGNLIQGGSFDYINDTDVYVVGDLISGRPSDTSDCEIYVNGDAAFFGNETYQGKVYVNGDVYIDREVNTGDKFPGGITIGGNVYLCSGSSYFSAQKTWIESHGIESSRIKNYSDASICFTVKNNDNNSAYNALRANMDKARSLAGGTAAYNYVWPSDSYLCESLTNVKATINEKIGNPEYSNWNMTKKFINDDGTYTVDPINYNFGNPSDSELERFAGTGSNENQLIVSAEKFGSYVIMGDMRITAGTWDGYNIVFDTTMPDGKDIDMYVYLPANCLMEKTGENSYKFSNKDTDKSKFNCFRWNNQPDGIFEGWFSVLTKGKGSVIFVVGDGVTYFAQQRLFMGHYNLLKEILPNSISADGKVTNTDTFSQSAIEKIMRTTDANAKLHTVFKQDVVDKYNGSGGLHNNLFVVAINKNSDVNFDMPYNTFCGFIYAPYMTFGAGKSTEGHFAMLGGLIVSDYEMPNTSRVYMATIPYDYYDRFVDSTLSDDKKDDARFDYMEKLISNSGGEIGTLGSSSSRSWRKYGYN